jgi:hypothetical protein
MNKLKERKTVKISIFLVLVVYHKFIHHNLLINIMFKIVMPPTRAGAWADANPQTTQTQCHF